MKETHKVILTDKEFGREVEIIFAGTLCQCFRFMDNTNKCKFVHDHYETPDNKFNVFIDKMK